MNIALTQGRLVLWYMRVRSHSLILSVDEHPKTDLSLWVIEMLRHPRFERAICLILENAERWKFRGGPISVVETREIESFMLVEGIVRNDLQRARKCN